MSIISPSVYQLLTYRNSIICGGSIDGFLPLKFSSIANTVEHITLILITSYDHTKLSFTDELCKVMDVMKFIRWKLLAL